MYLYLWPTICKRHLVFPLLKLWLLLSLALCPTGTGIRIWFEDGLSGFRIPVQMIHPHSHHDSTDRYYALGLLSYDLMVGLRSMTTVISHSHLFKALDRLFSCPPLRITIGRFLVSDGTKNSLGKSYLINILNYGRN